MPPDNRLENSLASAEDELNLIKNQIQQTLLDIREHILDTTNPFIVRAIPALEHGTGGALDAAVGVDGAADSETETYEEISEDVVEEQMEEPGAEEDEILKSDLGAPGEEEDVLVDSVDEPGDEESIFEEEAGGKDEEDLIDEELPADELGEADAEGDAEEDGLEAVDAPQAEPMDLISLAGLVRWVAATLERVGRARIEVLLDAYELAGRMSPEVKSVARTLCELADEDPCAGIPVRDIVGAMMRLEGVLGNGDGHSSRLLSLIYEDEFESTDSLVASLGLR